MKFPVKFSRYKGGSAGQPVLGSDTIPTTKPGTQDNFAPLRSVSKNGWPTKRVALAAAFFGSAATPPALNVSAYVWDDALGFWILCTGSATSITPGNTTSNPVTPTVPTFFDVPCLGDSAPTYSNIQSGTDLGTLGVLFIVSDNTAANGEYRFVVGPVLNEKSI